MQESKCKVIAILKLSIEIQILYTKIKNVISKIKK